MNDISELILAIVHPLVSHPEDVQLETDESDEFIEYHLSVHEEDVGRVIGKKGRVAKAIRTIVYSTKIDGSKRVRLTIVDN
ncbi:KH domain-containing protein [Desemzia sp. FAM 23989]|uniref:KH domain-containing protein n=1 Tax=Desemzia sp. FAM 23989 TaxID=3259523 RepID=UPI0038885D4E